MLALLSQKAFRAPPFANTRWCSNRTSQNSRPSKAAVPFEVEESSERLAQQTSDNLRGDAKVYGRSAPRVLRGSFRSLRLLCRPEGLRFSKALLSQIVRGARHRVRYHQAVSISHDVAALENSPESRVIEELVLGFRELLFIRGLWRRDASRAGFGAARSARDRPGQTAPGHRVA